jgi:hypothetical protein
MNFIIAITMLMTSVTCLPQMSPTTSTSSVMPTQTMSSGKTGNDIDILQYALILEHLENAFYQEGIDKFSEGDFTGFPLESKVVYQRFLEIASHEQTHVSALNSTINGLGGNAVPPCEYNFGITDVKDFVAKASVFERVGVAAYLFELPLISSNDYKTVGASIAEIESRHASFILTLNKMSGFPNAFDTPLSQRSVVTLASPFIKSCPFEIPVKGFSPLKLNKAMASVGDELSFDSSNATYCAFSVELKTTWAYVKDNTTCIVPENIYGTVFVHLTSDNSTMVGSDSSVVSGPTFLSVKMSDKMMKKMKNGDKYQKLTSSSSIVLMSVFTSLLSVLSFM